MLRSTPVRLPPAQRPAPRARRASQEPLGTRGAFANAALTASLCCKSTGEWSRSSRGGYKI